MWYLLVGTRGGPNRRRILEALREGPYNANQLSHRLGLDYRTVRHHLGLLERNGAVGRTVPGAYATPYELSPMLSVHLDAIGELPSPADRPRGRWSAPVRRAAAIGDGGDGR
jgi:hypothetical protein